MNPVYNREKYIQECVESVLTQDYSPLEIIAVDDGSTDSSVKILESYVPKIKFINQGRKGLGYSLNTGLKEATGEYISFLSSDDVFLPSKVKKQVNFMLANPEVSVVHTDWEEIDANGKLIQKCYVPNYKMSYYPVNIIKANFINSSTLMIKKECFAKVGFFDEKLPVDLDGDILLRLLKYYKFKHLAEILVRYRIHFSNISRDYNLMRESKDLVRKKALELFTPPEIFAYLKKPTPQKYAQEYEKLALALLKEHLYLAATTAIIKARQINQNNFLKRTLILLIIKILNTKFFIALSFKLPKFLRRKAGECLRKIKLR